MSTFICSFQSSDLLPHPHNQRIDSAAQRGTQNPEFPDRQDGKIKKAEAPECHLPKQKTGSVELPLLSSSSAVSNNPSSHVRPFPANPPQPPRIEPNPHVGILPSTSAQRSGLVSRKNHPDCTEPVSQKHGFRKLLRVHRGTPLRKPLFIPP